MAYKNSYTIIYPLRIIFILSFVLLSLLTKAQQQQYFRPGMQILEDYYTKFNIIKRDNGLSSNFVNCIYQDQQGYMWFGTDKGLNKYDGYDIQVYSYNEKDSSSISDNYINCITEDQDGNLWIGTENGLNKYNRKKDCFIRFNANTEDSIALQNNNIIALLSDIKGSMWIYTMGGFLHKLNTTDNSFTHFKNNNYRNIKNTIAKLWKDDNKIWLLCKEENTLIFDIQRKRFSYLEKSKILHSSSLEQLNSGYTSALKDANGIRYFGTGNSLGIVYNEKKNNIKALNIPSIYTMIKDSSGIIWLGGYSLGLLKYEPKSNTMTRFRHDESNPESIPYNLIRCLYIDRDKTLWIGTLKGIAKLNRVNNRFTHIRKIADNTNTIISNNIHDVIQTKDSNLWIASREGVSCYDLKTNKSINLKHKDNNINSLANNNVRTIYQDKNEKIWFGLWAGIGFDGYDIKSKSFTLNTFTSLLRGSDWYMGFAEDHFNNMYCALWSGDAFVKFDRTKQQFDYHYYRSPFSYKYGAYRKIYIERNRLWADFSYINLQNPNDAKDFRNELHGTNIYNNLSYNLNLRLESDEQATSIKHINDKLYFGTKSKLITYNNYTKQFTSCLKDKINISCIEKSAFKNQFWIGGCNGLYLINQNNNKILLHINTVDTSRKATYVTVQSLLLSHNKSLWIGTNNGLFKLSKTNFEQKKYICTKPLDAFNNKNIKSIIEDNDNNIWIACQDGLYVYENLKNNIRYFGNGNSNISSNIIYDLHIDKQGNIWVATQNGLNKYNPDTHDFTNWYYQPKEKNSLPSNTVLALASDDSESLYISTSKGLCHMNIDSGVVLRFETKIDNYFQGHLSTCILTDKKGNIWIGTDRCGEINYYNPTNNTFTHFSNQSYDNTSYKGNTANFIFEDDKGIIWIGSDKGLNQFDSIKQNFQHYTIDDGFPSNNIMEMLEDNNGTYWISTDNGLVHFSLEKGVLHIYKKQDGLQSNLFEPKAGWKLYDSRLVFGGDHGLSIFNPDSIKPIQNSTKPIFTQLYVYDSICIGDLTAYNNIKLNYSQNNFEITFTVPEYIKPQNHKYKYRLVGYDKEWVQTNSNNRKAKYTNLTYGTYTLELQASNSDGLWSDKTAFLNIKITPPYWLSPVAYVLYFITLIVIIIAIIHILTRQVKARNKKLKTLVEIRSKEIIEKNEELTKQKIADLIRKHQLEAIKEKISGEEKERHRLASELHDGIGGSLSGIKLYLENIYLESKDKNIKIILDDINKTYNEIRNISHDLLPPEFEYSDITEVVDSYISQLKQRTQISINFDIFPRGGWNRIEDKVQIEVYRIIQELLTNALKHSKASVIDLQLSLHSNYISIYFEDNGIGIKINKLKKGIGLRNVEERIARLNGRFEIDKENKNGTIITIEIPIIAFNNKEVKA